MTWSLSSDLSRSVSVIFITLSAPSIVYNAVFQPDVLHIHHILTSPSRYRAPTCLCLTATIATCSVMGDYSLVGGDSLTSEQLKLRD